MKSATKIVAAPLLLCVAQSGFAQSVLFEDLQVPESFPQSEGKALGSLQFAADLAAGFMTTNNVYRDASHLRSDATLIDLSTSVTASGERHLIVGTLEHYAQNFRDSAYQDMDLDAATATVFGRFVTSAITNLRLLVINEEDILGKTQSDQLNSFTSGVQQNRRAEAIFEIDNSRYFGNLMGRYDQIDADSFSKAATGLQDDALDRAERDYILLGGRSFSWGRAFVFGGTQTVSYESSSAPSLAERNSDETRYGLGAEYQVGRLSGAIDIFQFTQRFRSAAIPDIDNAWVGSGTLSYAASDRLMLVFAAEKSFHETNIPNSGGIFAENIFAGGTVALSPLLYLRAGPSYNRTSIQNTPVVLDRYELDVELGWQFSPHLKLLFTTNVFMQEAESQAFSGFDAQQGNAVLSVSYSL